MSEAEYLAETRRWLRYAREDLSTARLLVDKGEAAPRQACYLAQQAAEKGLKAALIFLQIDFPPTHNLNLLRNRLPPGWRVTEDHPDLADLAAWAVEARYPGDWPDATEADARAAVAQARAVLNSVREDLASHGFDADAS